MDLEEIPIEIRCLTFLLNPDTMGRCLRSQVAISVYTRVSCVQTPPCGETWEDNWNVFWTCLLLGGRRRADLLLANHVEHTWKATRSGGGCYSLPIKNVYSTS